MFKAANIERIAMVGFRAVGKTSVARELAALIGWTFVDMDEVFTKNHGMPISQWVALHGWELFRRVESNLLRELSDLRHVVVATGGGIVESEANISLLVEKFFVIWLKADLETIKKRMSSDKTSTLNRPPLEGKDIISEAELLLKKRTPLYQKVSRLSFPADSAPPSDIAKMIYRKLKNALNIRPC